MTISKKHFFIDTFSNAVYFGSKFLFNILIYSLLLNTFAIEEYGVYIFFAALMGQLEFIQSGFATSLQRFIPVYKDKTQIINLLGLVGIIYFLFGILFSIIIGVLSFFNVFDLLGFNDWWNYAKHLIYFAPLIWFFKAFSFALKGAKDFRIENLINLIFLLVELLFIYVMIEFNYGLQEILFGVLSILLLRHIGHFVAFYRRHGFSLTLLEINEMKIQFHKVKNFSFWNFVSAFSGTVLNQFDKVLVTVFLGPAALTIYYGINQFLKFYSSVSGVINSSVIPYFSEKVSLSDNKTFNQIALKGTMLTNYIVLILAGLLVLNSKVVFSAISKDYLLEHLTVFNLGIILYAFIGSRSFINKLYLCDLNLAKTLSIFGIITTLIYPIIFSIATSYFEISGAILSPILSHLIVFPFWLYVVFKKTSLKVSEYLWGLFQSSFPIIMLIGVVYFFNELLFNEVTKLVMVVETIAIIGFFTLIDSYKNNSLAKILR